ncbi:testis-expressed protein 9-like [Papaver somniferum]|uniref:testis-expressed protein 9-like n=1 Tax=Papaver somniferum TaxID=3469 RepID=UPI000E6F477B|nr:testis-expressed protein 9-like [Papaver somniferum]
MDVGSSSSVHTSFTISGPLCDSLGALHSEEFGSYTDEEMITAVPLYPDIAPVFDNLALNRSRLETALHRQEIRKLEDALQQEKERSRDLEIKLADAQDLDSSSEYRLMKRKWDIEKDLVENLRQRICNKDEKIDRQEAEIQQLQEELDKYRLFEYVPKEIDNLRDRLGMFQRLAAEQGRVKDLERDVHNLGQEVEQWKKAEDETKVKIHAAESRSEQLSQQIVDEKNAHQSELAEAIKAGVNEYIAQKRREVSQR